MQCFRVVYCGISHESLVFSRYTHKLLGECAYQENTSDKWDIPLCTMIRLLNFVRDIVAVHDGKLGLIPLNIQWLSCILIGCIFYGTILQHNIANKVPIFPVYHSLFLRLMQLLLPLPLGFQGFQNVLK